MRSDEFGKKGVVEVYSVQMSRSKKNYRALLGWFHPRPSFCPLPQEPENCFPIAIDKIPTTLSLFLARLLDPSRVTRSPPERHSRPLRFSSSSIFLHLVIFPVYLPQCSPKIRTCFISPFSPLISFYFFEREFSKFSSISSRLFSPVSTNKEGPPCICE